MSTTYDLDRKSLRRADFFLRKANALVAAAKKNTKALVVAGGGLFLVGLGFTGFKIWQNQQELKGAAEFYRIEKALAEILRAHPKTDANWKAKVDSFALEAKKPALDARFTSASFNIFLLLGDVYFDRGEFIEAFSYYRNAVEEAKSRHAKAAALVSAAYAAENLKNSDEAIAILRQVVASGVKEVKADAMLALARNLFQKGDRDGAVKQLNEVSKEFPNTVWATSAEGFQKLWTSEKSVSP